jgi:hypothetical protein
LNADSQRKIAQLEHEVQSISQSLSESEARRQLTEAAAARHAAETEHLQHLADGKLKEASETLRFFASSHAAANSRARSSITLVHPYTIVTSVRRRDET